MATGILALVGLISIIGGALPKVGYELDYGGQIIVIRSAWWGLSSTRFPIRLQHLGEWKRGRSYRQLPELDEYHWFIQGSNKEWSPMDLEGPPET